MSKLTLSKNKSGFRSSKCDYTVLPYTSCARSRENWRPEQSISDKDRVICGRRSDKPPFSAARRCRREDGPLGRSQAKWHRGRNVSNLFSFSSENDCSE